MKYQLPAILCYILPVPPISSKSVSLGWPTSLKHHRYKASNPFCSKIFQGSKGSRWVLHIHTNTHTLTIQDSQAIIHHTLITIHRRYIQRVAKQSTMSCPMALACCAMARNAAMSLRSWAFRLLFGPLG